MSVPLQPVKRQKCLNFEDESGAVKYVDEIAPVDEESQAITKLELWKSAGFSKPPPRFENGENTGAILFDLNKALEASKAAKSDRQVALENVQKAIGEFSQLISLTSALNTKEFVTLQGCQRPSFRPRGIPLPPIQVVDIQNGRFMRAEQTVEKGLAAARKNIAERRLFADGVALLKQFWRIGTRAILHESAQSISPIISASPASLAIVEKYKTLMIDCSFVSAGDNISTLDEFLVPLTVGSDGPRLLPSELDRDMKTMQLAVIHRTTGKVISSATAWESSVDSLDTAAAPVGTQVLLIHRHCQRRQHEAMCRRLFTKLSVGAMKDHDRWMVQPWLPLTTREEQPSLTSSSEPEFEPEATSSSRNNGDDGDAPSAILKPLFNERLLGSIEVTCIERGEIVLNLSDNLALSITLQPIPTTRPTADSPSVERRSRMSPDGLPLPPRRTTTTMTAGDSLHSILSQGLLKAQLSLLDHWRSHKAAAIASKVITTAAPPATTVVTSGSAVATAVTATAAATGASKLDDNLPEGLQMRNIINRLVNPELKLPAKDVGDGMAITLVKPVVTATGTGTATAIGGRRVTMEQSKEGATAKLRDATKKDGSRVVNGLSSSGAVLTDLLNVIRCGLLTQRLEAVLRRIESELAVAVAKDGSKAEMSWHAVHKNNTIASNGSASDDNSSRHLLAEESKYTVTFCSCQVAITVTPRYGFEVSSTVIGDAHAGTTQQQPLFMRLSLVPSFSTAVQDETANSRGSVSVESSLIRQLIHPASARFESILQFDRFLCSLL